MDYKKVHRKFITAISSFIVIIVLLVIVTYWLSLIVKDANWYSLILFVSILLGAIIAYYYKDKIDRILQISFISRIIANPGKPIPVKDATNAVELEANVRGKGFKLERKDNNHLLFYKLTKDPIRKTRPKYMLEVVVLLDSKQSDYYLDIVNEEIDAIQAKSFQNKQRITQLIVTQFKWVDALDETEKTHIKEIIFIRNNRMLISTINVGIHKDSMNAVMLYSDTYSPSLYYKYHIEQIKSWL